MPVAIESFSTEYDGDTVTITKGISRVGEGHELVRRFPHLFGPDGASRPRRAGARLHTRAAPRTTEDLRRYSVELTDTGNDAIARALNWTADGRETGGALLGWISGDTIVVDDASEPSDGDFRTSSSIAMHLGKFLALEQAHKANGRPWRLVGDWHTHEELTTQPSNADRRAWEGAARSNGGGLYVGVILTPQHGGSWRWVESPRIHAWVAQRNANGEPVIRPATLKGDQHVRFH